MHKSLARKIVSLAVLAASAVTLSPAFAVPPPPGFAEGVRAYAARRYGEAAGYFRQAASRAPNDALIHYYLGLSYQGTNQMTLAKAEYNFVAARAADPTLRSQASAALNNLSRYSTTYSGSSSTASAPRVASATGAPSSAPKISGKLQLYLFTADW
jgi:hypothetical protein